MTANKKTLPIVMGVKDGQHFFGITNKDAGIAEKGLLDKVLFVVFKYGDEVSGPFRLIGNFEENDKIFGKNYRLVVRFDFNGTKSSEYDESGLLLRMNNTDLSIKSR